MLESIFLLVLTTPSQAIPETKIPVQSVVISLIDDVELAFDDAGIVQHIRISPGNLVQKGDLLGVLDVTDAELEVRRVRAELEMAKLKADNDLSIQLSIKALGVAATEVTRAEKSNLKYKGTVSETEIDRLKLAREEAELQIQQAKHDQNYSHLQVRLKETELDIAQHNLERRQLRSPINGVVVKVEHQPGERAHPDQPFCRIIRMDRLRAEGFIHAEAGNVAIGQKVLVSNPVSPTDETQQIEGTITFVDPEIDTITGQFRVWAELANPNGVLKPGQRPSMVIETRVDSVSNDENSKSLAP
jgi:RND family efflux transporter MFP subunit